ncbi:MAG: hypothetical protein U0T36_10075 [Saprospiraceae bacterium]|jgi:hypothetical protein
MRQILILLLGLQFWACNETKSQEKSGNASSQTDTTKTEEIVSDQYNEFKIYPNGLIYSEKTMGKLSYIVDSLNLKFKNCHFNTVFHAQSQTIGHIIKIDNMSIKKAKKDMENQLPLDDFLKKYPKASIDRNVLILRSKYKNYENKDIVEFEYFDLKGDDSWSITSENIAYCQKDFTNQWLWLHRPKTEYSAEYLSAFYFPSNFNAQPISQKYAQMIGYADCLIDTTTSKFKADFDDGWIDLPENWTSMSPDNKAKLLDTMRSTRVIGSCSMDSRPRDHAIHIALLSAETYHWEVFLKAHLDIMNDRFERMSDGNYAWGQRNTYIKEIEELKINVPDLILGICFRIENPANNHYFGNIRRIGRALAESKYRSEIEQSILSIVSDKDLDIYNRLIFYFLFRNYNYFLEDEMVKKANADKLTLVAKTLPDFISDRLREN